MPLVIADTHLDDDLTLPSATREALRDASAVLHAGDVTGERALDRLQAAVPTLHAVAGNADNPGVLARLPTTETATIDGIDVAIVHRRNGGTTGLSLFGREREVAVVVFGHTHRPAIVETGPVTLLNPGSPTRPRGGPPTHAVLDATADPTAIIVHHAESGEVLRAVRLGGGSNQC